MIKKVSALLILLLLTSAQTKLVKVNLDKNVSIKLPADFVIMSDNDIATKYPSYRKPIAMYISPDRFADFGYNVSNGVWGNDIKLLHDVYKATINNNFSKVTFFRDTIITVKNRDFVEFEYVSEIQDESSNQTVKPIIKVYTFKKYALQNGEIYQFSFNCPEKYKDKYQLTAQSIMATAKINLIPNKHKPIMMESNKKNPNKGKQPENPFKTK